MWEIMQKKKKKFNTKINTGVQTQMNTWQLQT